MLKAKNSTIQERIEAFEGLIYLMKTIPEDFLGMCSAIEYLKMRGTIEGYMASWLLGVIHAELVDKRKREDCLLFTPRDMAPRVAWCEAKIAALKVGTYLDCSLSAFPPYLSYRQDRHKRKIVELQHIEYFL